VLDQEHRLGHICAVLHRRCCSAEGKVTRALIRCGVKNKDGFLAGLTAYRQLHSGNQTGLLHPSYRTADEKKALRKKRLIRRKT